MGVRAKGRGLAKKVKHKIYSEYPGVSESSPTIYTYYREATVKSYDQKTKKEAKSAK